MSDHPDLPNDADGGSIRCVLDHGSTLDRPMLIDFAVAAPNERAARQIAEAASKLGYNASCMTDEGGSTWTTTCSTRMVLSHHAVLAMQAELDTLAEPFGGHSDGWGTFGNAV